MEATHLRVKKGYMKAMVCTKYGPPDTLKLKKVDKPVPKNNEVLIKVHASTVTAGDCEIRRFDIPVLFWLFLRVILSRMKHKILGQEVAGVIEAVGRDVTRFKVGDPVFAPTKMVLGGYAEYICLPATHAIALKPVNMSFLEAATIPTGALNGLHFIRKANVQRGDKVLINGAGGSIGTYAIQIANLLGAEVTGVDSEDKLEMLLSIGASEVIDYKKEEFTRRKSSYDVIIDVVGNSSFALSMEALKPNGRYILGNPKPSGMIKGMFASKNEGKKVFFELAAYRNEEMEYLKKLVEDGKLKAVIDKVYTLEQLPEAHIYVEQKRKKGNVVISIHQNGHA